MYKLLRSKKGVALVNVLIITTVLMMLSVLLVDYALFSLRESQRQGNVNNTHYAGHSTTEVIFAQINKLEEDADGSLLGEWDGGSVGDDDDDLDSYANYILGKIKDDFTDDVFEIDMTGDEVAEVILESDDIVWVPGSLKKKDVGGEERFFMTIGVTVMAFYSPENSMYAAGNQEIYAQEEFDFPLPSDAGFEVLGSYTIGDCMVIGNGGFDDEDRFTANVKGDLYVFGSYPEAFDSPKQEYYGGIFVRDNAQLDIKGNAYVRSFIRAGLYKPFIPGEDSDSDEYEKDGSRINIYKDAVAQCIQIFGNMNDISVLRNAYTFTDIEINGMRSVIYINGSAVGLTRGEGALSHEQSSAIVNSASIHNTHHPDAHKSRVVVNGDVIIPGGTMWIDSNTGLAKAQIEDASLVWEDSSLLGSAPFYSLRRNLLESIADDDGVGPDQYHSELRRAYEDSQNSDNYYIGGKTNRFQVYNPRSMDYSKLNEPTSMDIDEELVKIRADNNWDKLVVEEISGEWSSSLAANNRVYNIFYSQDEDGLLDDNSGHISDSGDYVNTLPYINNDDYQIDNIFNEDEDGLEFAGSWGDYDDDRKEWVWGKLEDIEAELKKRAEIFVERNPEGEVDEEEDDDDDDEPRPSSWGANLKDAPHGHMEGDLFNYLLGELSSLQSNDYDNFIGIDEIDGIDDERYYLLLNTDPDEDIVIDGKFKGIIFTKGTVILESGANVYGSIIAAGGEYDDEYDDDLFRPAAMEGLKENENDLNELNNGDRAGIIIRPGDDYSVNEYLDDDVDYHVNLSFYPEYQMDTGDPIVSAEQVLDEAGLGYTDSIYLNKAARHILLSRLEAEGIPLWHIF
ncbi:polymer-forming cytoskeletal protein [Herbivorax sp. ANBcel31]|uniref:polymer-forming cytoskeletal protein n=1 Tax=Herbivorax sp. ANBcel31 TaxID=3069754 RepID=UPI0027B43933|nr:polymer-forming cytoskeletal protein [Herbivorax sp. ANBcel31]MDQ2085837.1 polymer-forming cytoskeletal protein [Herbivorax sp. ANBcel31]